VPLNGLTASSGGSASPSAIRSWSTVGRCRTSVHSAAAPVHSSSPTVPKTDSNPKFVHRPSSWFSRTELLSPLARTACPTLLWISVGVGGSTTPAPIPANAVRGDAVTARNACTVSARRICSEVSRWPPVCWSLALTAGHPTTLSAPPTATTTTTSLTSRAGRSIRPESMRAASASAMPSTAAIHMLRLSDTAMARMMIALTNTSRAVSL